MVPPILHVVCAWCLSFGRPVAAVLVEGDRTQPVSHGMCPACANEWQIGKAA